MKSIKRKFPYNSKYFIFTLSAIIKMENICALFDAQGFIINEEFYIRELAVTSLKDNSIQSWDAEIPQDFDSLSTKDKITNEYIRRNITGLSFNTSDADFIPFRKIRVFLVLMWNKYKTPTKQMIGVKNLGLAKILDELNIPYLELKAPSIANLKNYYRSTYFCMRHKECPDALCSIQKLMLLRMWIKDENSFKETVEKDGAFHFNY